MVALDATVPGTADRLLNPAIGVVMALTMLTIIVQSIRHGGVLITLALATALIAGPVLATELLLMAGIEGTDTPFGERLETYGFLLVGSYLFGLLAYGIGLVFNWISDTAEIRNP